MKKFRIKPGSRVDLSKYDPDDRSASFATKEEDAAALSAMQARLDALQDVFYAAHAHKLLVVLQGMDTSGKDGTIRHVFNSVDPLGVRVASFKVPTEEEKDHDFLWRVHRVVPGAGEIAIFNRSHYEDILVTRAHGWIDGKEAKHRIAHINAFEALLADAGTVIVKFFLHISRDEQKRRLEERIANQDKQWKFAVGDLGERKLWDRYVRAYEDALSGTSTACAPWYVVPANSKTNRNLMISRVLVKTLEKLRLEYPRRPDLAGIVVS